MIRKLIKYKDYSRKEVHDIFAPKANFTLGAGKWGLWGIIDIPDRKKDYIFFVTYGRRQGDHEFDEHITEDGILTWQSQPSQKLENKDINLLIIIITKTIFICF
jgi:hypothetical protein